MPRADFQVTLQFRGYPVPEGVIGEGYEHDEWLRNFRDAVVAHAEGSGMCEDWRNAFRRDEATAHDLTESAPETHTFTVSIRPRLTARVAVNSGMNVQEAVSRLDTLFRDMEWSEVADIGNITEDSVEVYVEHYGSYTDDVPDDFDEVSV